MDTAKHVVVEPPKSAVPPVKAQPPVEHKAEPKATGCCGSQPKPKV